jgi:hypothetical protein
MMGKGTWSRFGIKNGQELKKTIESTLVIYIQSVVRQKCPYMIDSDVNFISWIDVISHATNPYRELKCVPSILGSESDLSLVDRCFPFRLK